MRDAARAARVAAVGAIFASVIAATCAAPAIAQVVPIDAAPLPMAARRVPASAEECVVWNRELSFATSVQAHEPRAFESFLHEGTVFNVGAAEADRGRAAVAGSWGEIVEGKTIALRWRPGIVQIGGEAAIAASRGPYILHRLRDGVPVYRVGLFQTVWVRDARDGVWRVLFDGSATSPQPVADRAAADRWVEEQAMSDCAGR